MSERYATVFSCANRFGFKRIVHYTERNELRLLHGDFEHGRQSLDPEKSMVPLGYFHREGPLGDAMEALAHTGDIAVVGLGIGAAATYARPGQRMVFLELDPDVVHVARDLGAFSYLGRSAGQIEVRVGDGLALLQAALGEQFALIVIDAYDEQTVPGHLVDAAALQVYLDRLAPGGVVVVAATHFADAVLPVLRAGASQLGLALRTRLHEVSPEEELDGDRQKSRYVALARTVDDLAPLAALPTWVP